MDYAVATLMGQYSPMIYTKLPDAIAEGSIGRNLMPPPPSGFKALRAVMSSAHMNMEFFLHNRYLLRMDSNEGVKDSVYPPSGLPSMHWERNNKRSYATNPDVEVLAILDSGYYNHI